MMDNIPTTTILEPVKNKIDTAKIKSIIVNFLVPLICLGVLTFMAVFIAYPSYKNIPRLTTELEQKESLKATLTHKLSLLNRLIDYKNSVDENSTLVDKALSSEANVPQLLDEVNQVTVGAGMKLLRLNYSYGSTTTATPAVLPNGSATQDPNAYSTVDVSLSSEGTYDQLLTFLKNVENAARILYVSNMRFSGADANKKDILSFSFSIVSPYMHVQSNAVTDDPITLDISSNAFVEFINKIKGYRIYEFSNSSIVIPSPTESSSTSKSDKPAVQGLKTVKK